MADRFGADRIGISDVFTHAEVADYSAGNYDFTDTPRGLNCSLDGTIKVDMLGEGTDIALYVVAGFNPYRITRIYNEGSDAMTVVGLS
jgi:hypothetical protein